MIFYLLLIVFSILFTFGLVWWITNKFLPEDWDKEIVEIEKDKEKK